MNEENRHQKRIRKMQERLKSKEEKLQKKSLKKEARKTTRKKFFDFSMISLRFLKEHPQGLLYTFLVLFYLMMNIGICILALKSIGILPALFFAGETLLQLVGLFYALNYLNIRDVEE